VSAPVKISISVEPSQVGGVTAALRRVGAAVEEVLEEIGTITASCEESTMPAVSAIPGVLSVERQGTVQVPKPGSPVQ
jgi:hypothetical protein